MDASQPSPVTVEVMDAPTPQADLVAGRVAPVAVQASTKREFIPMNLKGEQNRVVDRLLL
jgi:hypothetical protein